jgi:anti-sigma regulatory factor (Ser/Thr protein kinase)
MNRSIIIIRVENNADVVLVRQRAHALAELAGFDTIKQTSFATALSEISRNALQYARAGRVDFTIEIHGAQSILVATVSDNGPGIEAIRANGGHWSRSVEFSGHGIASARKLVKNFSIECAASGGTVVKLGVPFQPGQKIPAEAIAEWMAHLVKQQPRSFLEEMQHRNQELVATLEAFQHKEI